MTESKPPIAYLTGEYPKVSHTFIQREIEALRTAGWPVLPCTIRRAAAKDVVGAAQKEEEKRTFAVIAAAKKPATLLGAQIWALKTGRWGRTLKLAWKTRPPGLKAGLWQMFYFLEAAVLARHLAAQGVRHIHNHFADSSGSVTMLTAELAGIPFSMTMHGPALFYEPRWWRLDEKTARAAFVSCISHFCRSQAMYFSKPDYWDKLKIVHCGVDPARYGRADIPRGKRLIFVGRLAAVKGLPILVEAFARLRERHPDAHLSIVGDGPERKPAEARVAGLGIGDAVTFHGYQSSDEVSELLARSDVMVLPSFAEGVPVVLMEAMASGLPVVASRVAGVQELVDDGVSGYAVPPGDVDSLVARLDTLLADPDLCARMGAAGRAKVAAEFDQAAEARWLERILSGSLAGKLPDGLRP
ncbi:glycosyltransferase [Paenirhodobacter populi]|uniref:Colanic acid biosynthesis glycosyltransferase WcaL n=1 Tax=Paenirhodobacter populi TaxID=2306993 RepID=A0A443JBY1_9RHOB|nr:glycosyltransferase [Sinirhodobacter populi]RWR18031.1 colanic acid biosynthesis glycosyltransferase WcaL [Sinirhodobacter populi]